MVDYIREAERIEKEAGSETGVVKRIYLKIGELYRESDRGQKIRTDIKKL